MWFPHPDPRVDVSVCPTGHPDRSIRMQKPTYRIVPRNEGRVLDVEITTPGSPPRIVNCFNREEDAWQWVDE
jgi:hypothetical protein